MHPAAVLHASASLGHLDPRLNLVDERGVDPLLRLTGATATCASEFGGGKLYDMVGNLDEWVESDPPEFVGGFYARMSTQGCEARVGSHAAIYYDYSTGTRCCRDD
jgi:formylglycine-generating enzyme required for sulfatase activity